MIKAIIVFGSTTGNTEKMSEAVATGLKAAEFEVVRKNVADFSPETLKDYELIVLGCSTWGDGELQDDFIQFEEGLRNLNLAGKKAAVFGPGDSMYAQYCKAVDILTETLKAGGAEIVTDNLKIDGEISEDVLDEAKDWGVKMAGAFEENQS
ncbi:flavodoxin [bacterium]|nr:flavodoxin [bacterium]